MKNIIKTWREAASLMILAKQDNQTAIALSRQNDCRNNSNYAILLQTRTNSATAFANSVVFPGGVIEAADASGNWIDLIKSYGYKQHHFNLFHCDGSNLTPLFKDNPIQRHIDLRITAIRETFEETGLLFCSRHNCRDRSGPWARVLVDIDIPFWQEKISKNPKELFNLCEKENCYPDIWGLHYWSNWLTPTHLKKRFNTAFFVVALESRPQTLNATNETAKLEWTSIGEILEKNAKLEAHLVPTQLYELHRLNSFESVDDLVSFAERRSGYGTDLFFPIRCIAKDGVVFLSPGDDYYPANVDYAAEPLDCKDKTVLELREGAHSLHRLEFSKERKNYIIQNFTHPNHVYMGDTVIKAYTI